jgi:hypothetical protein
MVVRRYYPTGDLVKAETAYKLVRWVYNDPKKAADAGAKLIGLGLAILGIACLAEAFKE